PSSTFLLFFFSSRRRHTRSKRDWSSDVCSSDLCPLQISMVNQPMLNHVSQRNQSFRPRIQQVPSAQEVCVFHTIPQFLSAHTFYGLKMHRNHSLNLEHLRTYVELLGHRRRR